MPTEPGHANLISTFIVYGSFVFFPETSEKIYDAPLKFLSFSKQAYRAVEIALTRAGGNTLNPKLSDLLKLVHKEPEIPTDLDGDCLEEIKSEILSFYNFRKEKVAVDVIENIQSTVPSRLASQTNSSPPAIQPLEMPSMVEQAEDSLPDEIPAVKKTAVPSAESPEAETPRPQIIVYRPPPVKDEPRQQENEIVPTETKPIVIKARKSTADNPHCLDGWYKRQCPGPGLFTAREDVEFQNQPELFNEYAIALFVEAGHTDSTKPAFSNHSAERFVYFDFGDKSVSLSSSQRDLLRSFDNVSRLFTANGCEFFSINLSAMPRYRSAVAHDVHTMIHPLSGAQGTIVLFHCNGCVLLSFMGFGYHCMLSDWYTIPHDDLDLRNKLDIANMTILEDVDYFSDFVYILARPYYLVGKAPATFSLIPIDAHARIDSGELERDDIDLIVKEQLLAPQYEYSYDYVEYDEQANPKQDDISADIDLMLLEIDDDDEDDNPFGEVLESDDEGFDEFGDEYTGEFDLDEYGLDDVDPNIFKDPTLMVKWLKQMDSDQEQSQNGDD